MSNHDVIVVGGGPAGVGTAYELRDSGLDVVVLEAAPAVGGRTLSVDLPGGKANTGALFLYRGTRSEEVAAELGLSTVPFLPTTYGISEGGRTSVSSDLQDLVDGLHLADDERAALLGTLQDAVAEYRGYTAGGQLSRSSTSLAAETVAQRFATLPERARRILETAVQGGSVGRTDTLSAQYALRYFASYPALERENRLLALEGQQALSLGMAARLPEGSVHLSTAVERVVPDEASETYLVTATGPDGPVDFRAPQVVLAVPAPLVDTLVAGLPEWKRTALAVAETPGSTVMIVAADVTGVEEHRDWSFVTTVGAAFDCIINPAPGPQDFRDGPEGEEIVHYMCYGNSAGHRPDVVEDPALREAWLEDFLTVAPGLRGRIRAVHLQTWEHCFALLSPQRAAAVPELRREVGGLHFAGDWTSETAGTHGALVEAGRVAAEIRARRIATATITG
ncbi:flavin monoamine oxidase family protein [Pseudonocardia halophobica]|uniref:flavin monoamine oxidase family protein n=1 Tax=Pseudonocardia halophobica TaxID=29401 RepID=UPI003D8C94E5